jgi:DNA-binding transcriptional LysR family regulator
MIDLKGADLSLLVSLDALIDEANVTKAAERLNISQPALSAQLARLRDLFHDPLLVSAKGGRGMVLTPRALELKLPLHLALKDLETVVKRPPTFDPVSADRTFSIACSDQVTAVLGVRLIGRAQKLAGSGVRISFRTPNPELITVQLERGQLDLLIGDQRNVPHGMTSQRLYDEHHVMAQRKGHPRGTKPLDLEAYCDLSHILVSNSGIGSFRGDIDEQLEKIGRRRNVVYSVHQFVIVPMLLRTTDCVAALPSRLLERFAGELDAFELPFIPRGYTVSAAWHPRFNADPAHIWVRDQISAVAGAAPPRRKGPRRNGQ